MKGKPPTSPGGGLGETGTKIGIRSQESEVKVKPPKSPGGGLTRDIIEFFFHQIQDYTREGPTGFISADIVIVPANKYRYLSLG